jgi:Tfp pilus assembly protein PilV
MTARTRSPGYTVVEVMIAMAILMIGTTGIVAMQKVTTVSNRDSKNLVVANQIARAWVERLRADATQWNNPSPTSPTTNDMGNTRWLGVVNGLWFRPANDTTHGEPAYAAADVFGNDVPIGSAATVYCTNVRLSWLYGPPGTVEPPYLLRAEIRVLWLRDGGPGPVGATACENGAVTWDNIGPMTDRFHFVYVATAVTQNMARP